MKILVAHEYEDWFGTLTDGEAKTVANVVAKLEVKGINLDAPHSSAVEGTDLPLRELRPKAGASPLRVIYAFDNRRDAVLLIGGDKGADKRMYERLIPKAEQIFKQHLEDLENDP